MTLWKIGLGRSGEKEAVELLQQSGYKILGRNVRAKFGEIDVVARDGQTLCFIEVKARSTTEFGFPEEGVVPQKRRQLIRLAQWYLQRERLPDCPVRFDVVSILFGPNKSPARTRLIKGAFEA